MSRIAALRRRMRKAAAEDRGMALMLVLMIMMLLSALMIGFMTSIMADTRSSGVDRDETQAYAVAHAGMEKLTSDLSALFLSDYSPNGTQITTRAAVPPSISGFTYTDPDGSNGYKVQFTAKTGTGPCPAYCTIVSTPTTAIPVPDDPTTGTTIAAGPYQGFKGLVTHYNIIVTAKSTGGSEIRMRRELQTVAVPVFQFGLFSESSLAFHSADDFNFGGRVHTNGDLFIAGGNGSPAGQLWLGDKVTAVGEVVRKYLDNGLLSTTLYPGAVNMATGTNVYRVLSATNNSGNGEGSVKNNIPCSATASPACQNEPVWTNLSIGAYNGYLRNGRTGAKRLDLPLVSAGAFPIDLIRRPRIPAAGLGEDNTAPLVYAQRYYTQASLRILLSDVAADITGLPQVSAGAPISLEGATLFGPAAKKAPLATSAGTGNYRSSATTPLIGGVIKIELQQTNGTWTDVTQQILDYGITGRNLSNGTADTVFTGSNGQNSTANGCLANAPQPDAILRLQRVKDVPSTHSTPAATALLYQYDCAVTTAGLPSATSTDYWPNVLYDTREALRREEAGQNVATELRLGGAMYYLELDTNNLAKWFRAVAPYAGGSGALAKNDNNGYIVYFSDRRNNRNTSGTGAAPGIAVDRETAEYGNEDSINVVTAGGAVNPSGAPNGVIDPGEDVNAETLILPAVYAPVLETYGTVPVYNGTHTGFVPGAAAPLHATANPYDVLAKTSQDILRGNRPIFFRRALKLTEGDLLRTSGITGLTIASENPVYVEGDYNVASTSAFATETHVAAAIIADAITVLSNNWNDVRSFNAANDTTLKPPSNTNYRFAAVTGKNISFTSPTGWASPGPETNFGMDGGAHNLLRQLEGWGTETINYRGSIVSFFISRQATGIFKCCLDTYTPPNRVYNFDTDFLLPDKLPPGTPMFRDVNTLTFRQLLRPNQ